MDHEEMIIYDVEGFKKELEDPLSVEEVAMRDPLDSEACSQLESHITFKEEPISSWNKTTEVENEECVEVTGRDHHPDSDAGSGDVTSYSVSQRETSDEHPVQSSMAPFLPSVSLPSHLEPPHSPFQVSAVSYGHSDTDEPSASPGLQMQTDQDELSNTQISHPEATDLQSPEIIIVDSDSETEQRLLQQVLSSNSNSESGIWSKTGEVSASSGINYNLEDGSEEHTVTDASTNKKISNRAAKTHKAKQKKRMKLSKTSSSVPTQPANEPVSKESLTDLGKPFSQLQQMQQTVLASQQATMPSQQTGTPNQQSLLKTQQSLLRNQQSLLKNQQTWSPLHQILSLSSQLLNQQQSDILSGQGPQLLIQGSQVDQQSLMPIRYPQTAQVASAQRRVVPPSPKSSFVTSRARMTGSRSMATADATKATKPTAKPQVQPNTGSVSTEREFLDLKHKMEVQELKLRLRNRKAKAELKESELKLKMEANVQDLTNKKLKHDILLAKLQFYSKLCSVEKL